MDLINLKTDDTIRDDTIEALPRKPVSIGLFGKVRSMK